MCVKTDYNRQGQATDSGAFMFGVIECQSCYGAEAGEGKKLQVRLMDGHTYTVEENSVSKTIDRIHGLFCGKTIHVSGEIDSEAKAIKLHKVRALGASRGTMIRRMIEAGSSSFHSDKYLKAGIY